MRELTVVDRSGRYRRGAAFLCGPRRGSIRGATEPILKPVKERNGKTQEPEAVVNAGMTKQQRLSLCLGSWDAETHMSKQEWRVACQRTVRDYPDAFVR